MTPRPGRRLVLVRHGRTEFNHTRRIQGQVDVELDDTGHAQAAAAAPALAAYSPVALWSSDLARARQTAAYLAKETGLEAVHDARLREFFLGSRQGLTHEEYAAAHPAEFAIFRDLDFDVVPDGEPSVAVRERMTACLRELLDSAAPGETVMAVSHGAAVREALVGLLEAAPGLGRVLRPLGNCHRVVLEEKEHEGPLRLAGYNLGAHA